MIATEPKMNELKEFYSNHLYNAINQSVLSSLKCLAEACGFQIESTHDLNAEIDIKTDDSDSMKYIRLKTSDDLMRRKSQASSNENIDERAISVSSVLSKTQWVDERKLEQAYLQ